MLFRSWVPRKSVYLQAKNRTPWYGPRLTVSLYCQDYRAGVRRVVPAGFPVDNHADTLDLSDFTQGFPGGLLARVVAKVSDIDFRFTHGDLQPNNTHDGGLGSEPLQPMQLENR